MSITKPSVSMADFTTLNTNTRACPEESERVGLKNIQATARRISLRLKEKDTAFLVTMTVLESKLTKTELRLQNVLESLEHVSSNITKHRKDYERERSALQQELSVLFDLLVRYEVNAIARIGLSSQKLIPVIPNKPVRDEKEKRL